MKPQIKKPLAKGLVTATHKVYFKSNTHKAIALLACWGIVPIVVADWLITVGGLSHE